MAEHVEAWRSLNGNLYQTEQEADEADFKFVRDELHRFFHLTCGLTSDKTNHALGVLEQEEERSKLRKLLEDYDSVIIRRS